MSSDDKKDSNQIPVDKGLKSALENMGENAPEKVSPKDYEDLSKKVSQGARLRMEQKAMEQKKVVMWKSRVNLLKKARFSMENKNFAEAAANYEKYLRILEIIYDLKPGEITPEIFNKSKRSKELTAVTSVYWDLVRIYDSSKAYKERLDRAIAKLALFLPYSTVHEQIIKKAQNFERSAKNPASIRYLLRAVKANRRGCFIATAVYQDGLHTDVVTLRSFRDQHLQKHFLGRIFTQVYYICSPRVAGIISRSQLLRRLLRPLLERIAQHIKKYT